MSAPSADDLNRMPPVVRLSDEVETAAERWSRPPREGDRIVLLLHGLGSHEGDLPGLVPYLPQDLVYVALRGIHSFGGGFAWLDFPIDPEDRSLLAESAAAVEHWINAHEQTGAGRVIGSIGFSQGAILTLELARRNPGRFTWIAPLSGAPFPAPLPGDDALAAQRLPVFWGHGGQDPLFTPDIDERTRAWLSERTDLTEVTSPNLGHGVDERVLGGLSEFITAHLGD